MRNRLGRYASSRYASFFSDNGGVTAPRQEHNMTLTYALIADGLRRFREVTHRCSREVTHLLGNQELN